MRRRLYFILPDLASAKTVHNELLLARIDERHMHVVARDGISLEGLPEASLLQKSDLVHGAQLGLVIGGFTGVVLGTLAVLFGYIVPGLEVVSVGAVTFGGAFIGTWTSTMVAVNIPNSRLRAFSRDIESGRLLFMVDVAVTRLDEITKLVQQHHPEAGMRDIEPTIPAFP